MATVYYETNPAPVVDEKTIIYNADGALKSNITDIPASEASGAWYDLAKYKNDSGNLKEGDYRLPGDYINETICNDLSDLTRTDLARTDVPNMNLLKGLKANIDGQFKTLNDNLGDKTKIVYKDYTMTTQSAYINIHELGVGISNFVNAVVLDTNSIICLPYTYSNSLFLQFKARQTMADAPGIYKVRLYYSTK